MIFPLEKCLIITFSFYCNKSQPLLLKLLAKLENYSLLVKYVRSHFRPSPLWKPRIYVPWGARW